MNVVNEAKIDELLVNLDLAKSMTEDPSQLHIVKGQLGYRVRVDTKDGWRMINYKNPQLVSNLEQVLGLKVTEDNGVFHATLPGQRASAKATSRALAVVLAALKAPLKQGVLSVAL
jgi:hypothetical protein